MKYQSSSKQKSFWIISVFILSILLANPALAMAEVWNTLVSDTQLTTADVGSWNPKIVIDPQNNSHITWFDYRSGSYEIYYTKIDNDGNTIIEDTQLTSTITGSFWPSIDLDANNNVHISWHDERQGNLEIYYTKLDSNGNTLVDDLRITANSGASAASSIAVDKNDNVHIVWNDNSDGNYEIYYTKLDNNGNTLIEDTRLTFDTTESQSPVLVTDSQGDVHVAWVDLRDSNWDLYYTKLDNNGNTLIDDTRITTADNVSANPAIAIDSVDNIHLAWYYGRDRNAEIYYKKLDNAGNVILDDVRVSSDRKRSYWPAIAIDSTNSANIAWYDNRDGNFEIYFSKVDQLGNIAVENTRLTSDANISYVPSLGVDSYDKLHLIWQDYRSGRREIFYKKGKIISRPTVKIGQMYSENSQGFWDMTHLPADAITINLVMDIQGDTDQTYNILMNYYYKDALGNNTLLQQELYQDYAPGTYFLSLDTNIPQDSALGVAMIRNSAVMAKGKTLLDRDVLATYLNIVSWK